MLIISGSSLNGLVTEIASRLREIHDHNGEPVILPTIPPDQIRAAALSALFVGAGQVIWPGDVPINLKRKASRGFVDIQE